MAGRPTRSELLKIHPPRNGLPPRPLCFVIFVFRCNFCAPQRVCTVVVQFPGLGGLSPRGGRGTALPRSLCDLFVMRKKCPVVRVPQYPPALCDMWSIGGFFTGPRTVTRVFFTARCSADLLLTVRQAAVVAPPFLCLHRRRVVVVKTLKIYTAFPSLSPLTVVWYPVAVAAVAWVPQSAPPPPPSCFQARNAAPPHTLGPFSMPKEFVLSAKVKRDHFQCPKKILAPFAGELTVIRNGAVN